MQKLAQTRSILNKLKEQTNVSGIAAERFFNDDFLRVMQSLRNTDNNIRSIIVGKPVEGGDAGRDPASIKQLLKDTKSNLNRREYMAAIADLGRFHAKFIEVANQINGLSHNVDKVHHDFLFKDLKEKNDPRFEHLKELKKRLGEPNNYIIKEAGIMDFFHNIGTRRGRALAAWEKKYPKVVQKLRENILLVLNKSQSLYDIVLSQLKELADARASRNVDDYMKAGKVIANSLEKYDIVFRDFYHKEVKPWMDKTDAFKDDVVVGDKDIGATPAGKIEETTVPEQEAAPLGLRPEQLAGQVGKQTSDTPPIGGFPHFYAPPVGSPLEGKLPIVERITPAPAVEANPPTLRTGPPVMQTPVAKSPAVVQTPTAEVSPAALAAKEKQEAAAAAAIAAAKKFKPPTGGKADDGITASHIKFYKTLEKMSGESPAILASYINKYARSIQSVDPETSIKLFGISKAIRK